MVFSKELGATAEILEGVQNPLWALLIQSKLMPGFPPPRISSRKICSDFQVGAQFLFLAVG